MLLKDLLPFINDKCSIILERQLNTVTAHLGRCFKTSNMLREYLEITIKEIQPYSPYSIIVVLQKK